MKEFLEDWKNTPCMNRQIATSSDVESKKAIFVIENDDPNIHKAYDIDLPQLAYLDEEGEKSLVIIIQVKECSEGIIVGYKNLEGDFGAGFSYQFEILGEEDIEKLIL